MKKLLISSLLMLSTSLWAIQVGDMIQYNFHRLNQDPDKVTQTIIDIDEFLNYYKIEVDKGWRVDEYRVRIETILSENRISEILRKCENMGGERTNLVIKGISHPSCKLFNVNFHYPVEPGYKNFEYNNVWIGHGTFDGILKYQMWDEHMQPSAYIVIDYN